MARRMAKALLFFIVLIDVSCLWEFWRHGPPLTMSQMTVQGNEVSFRIAHASLTTQDYVALAILIAFQISLVAFLWRSRRKVH